MKPLYTTSSESQANWFLGVHHAQGISLSGVRQGLHPACISQASIHALWLAPGFSPTRSPDLAFCWASLRGMPVYACALAYKRQSRTDPTDDSPEIVLAAYTGDGPLGANPAGRNRKPFRQGRRARGPRPPAQSKKESLRGVQGQSPWALAARAPRLRLRLYAIR